MNLVPLTAFLRASASSLGEWLLGAMRVAICECECDGIAIYLDLLLVITTMFFTPPLFIQWICHYSIITFVW